MDVKTSHTITIEGEAEEVERLEPILSDLTTVIAAVERRGPATKMSIVDPCRPELTEVMQENSERRLLSPGDTLHLLATHGVIDKKGEKFYPVSSDQ
jgi:hypothetical protein